MFYSYRKIVNRQHNLYDQATVHISELTNLCRLTSKVHMTLILPGAGGGGEGGGSKDTSYKDMTKDKCA